MKTLTEQLREAQEAYQKSHAKHPKAAITIRLWVKLRDLKTRVIRQEARAAA